MTTTSSTTSATSAIITALGAGSGINMAELASNLAAAQFAGRTDRLTSKSDTLERQISAASSLKSMLLSLATSLGTRVREGDLSPQPQIANTAVARASLTGTTTPSGTYTLEVTTLAAAQALSGPAFASSATTVGSGTLTLRFGTVAGATFTEDTAHAAVDVTIASGATLADVAAAINSKGAGVSAYVANTTDGAKLVLKGQEGAANGFILQATETVGDPGLAQLAWEPATGAASQLLASAGNAAFKVDGLAMTATSNSVSEVVPGLKLTLAATNTGSPTKITFADPTSAITSTMQDLTSALNEIAAELAKATDRQSGDLSRDSGALAFKRTLSSLTNMVVMPGAATGAPSTLADLGLTTKRDGTFQLDATRLAATLKADPAGAAAMFTNGLNGIFATIDSVAREANSAANPGSLGGSLSRYTSQKTKVGEDQAKLAEQQEALRARLVTRFAVADNHVGASKSTLSFLKNQIAVWNSPNN